MNEQPSLPPDEHDATLKTPQFSLRTLLVVTTVAAGLLALMMSVGAVWAMAILFFLALVGAHVIGNSLGTRLRDGAVARSDVRSVVAGPVRASKQTTVPDPTRLQERNRLHWINGVFTIAGAIAGGYYGGTALAETYPEATMAACVLAYISSGVLGGFAVFAGSSFLSVVRQALSEAHAGSDRRGPQMPRTNSIERN